MKEKKTRQRSMGYYRESKGTVIRMLEKEKCKENEER